MNDWLIFGLSVTLPALILLIVIAWNDINKRKPRRHY